MAVSLPIDPSETARLATRRAGELAEHHFGAVARWQLLRDGVTSAQIGHWLAAGRMFRRYPGVYAWGRPDLPEKGELAAGLLFAGHGAALGGLTCLWWLALLGHRPDRIHIDAPRRCRSRQDLRIRHPGRIDRSFRRGLPVTDLPSALLVASADLSHDTLRLVLARAEFERILSLTELQSAFGRGRPGSGALRRAMDAHLPQLAKCVNPFERDFVLLCERFRLPIPEPNVRIGRFVPDMLWEDRRLIVELDGRDAHRTPAQRLRDVRRQRSLEERGYTVLRFGWDDVHRQPGWVAERVRAALAL